MRRRIGLTLATLLLTTSGIVTTGIGAAGAGEVMPPTPTITTVTIAKHVVGAGAGSTTVRVECEMEEGFTISFDFDFDASGQPTTTTLFPNVFDIEKLDGAWRFTAVATGTTGPPTQRCRYTEIGTGGAATTSWTCGYSNTPTADPPADEVVLGCSESNGAGIGPATVTYGFTLAGVATQTSTVTFTNTFDPTSPPIDTAPAAIEVQPTLTG